MDFLEITQRNKEIKIMLGWKEATLDYKMEWCGASTEETLLRVDPDYIPSLEKDGEPFFDTWLCSIDWRITMEGYKFISEKIQDTTDEVTDVGELLIYEWDFGLKNHYIKVVQLTESGFDINMPGGNILYTIGENCENIEEAFFLCISDFAKLFNTEKEKYDP